MPLLPPNESCFYFSQEESMTANEVELKSLKESLQDTQPMGGIVTCCRTLDQVCKNVYYTLPVYWWYLKFAFSWTLYKMTTKIKVTSQI